MRTRLLALLFLALLAGGLAACGSDDDNEAAATTAAASTTPEPAAKPDGGGEPPEDELDAAKTYSLVVETNCGSFTIELDQKLAPETSASLVGLANDGFFDSTTFHRVVPGFVIQGGDPTGTGSGGPGYSTVDAPPATAKYTKGVVAMAKTGAEAPGTSGSQFFVVTGEDVGLPPDYAILGKVTEGMDVVDVIGVAPVGADEQPTDPIVMESVTVSEE